VICRVVRRLRIATGFEQEVAVRADSFAAAVGRGLAAYSLASDKVGAKPPDACAAEPNYGAQHGDSPRQPVLFSDPLIMPDQRGWGPLPRLRARGPSALWSVLSGPKSTRKGEYVARSTWGQRAARDNGGKGAGDEYGSARLPPAAWSRASVRC